MGQEHPLSDKTQAQARVQMQIVTQLEVQLKKEKVRLAAMMKHLHPKTGQMKDDSLQSPEPKRHRAESPVTTPFSLSNLPKMSVPELLKNQVPSGAGGLGGMAAAYTNPLAHLMSLTPASQSMSPLAALSSSAVPPPPHSPTSTPLRGTLHDKSGEFN